MCIEDTDEWADHLKCARCYEVSRSFYGMSWAAILMTHSESAAFRSEWAKAEKIWSEYIQQDQIPDWPVATRVLAKTTQIESLRSTYLFVTLPEFWRIFQVEPKTIGLKIVTKRAENGKELSGILIRPSPAAREHNFREFVVSTETTCVLEECLVGEDNRLREAQPQDTFTALSTSQTALLDRGRMHATSHVSCKHWQPLPCHAS